jgi:transcriptional regulator with XRE-family HTH domain
LDATGTYLRAARQRWGLTLREVENRSNLLAQQWGNSAFNISASWLDRIERENRALSAAKLIVLMHIYDLTADQMLAFCRGTNGTPVPPEEISSPNVTSVHEERLLEEHSSLWLPNQLATDVPDEDKILPPSSHTVLPAHYQRAIIGRQDRTMEPMILPGSIVLIDSKKRTIARRKDWTNEFDRPIYFLLTRTGYACGFCELDKKAELLTLVPHVLSFAPHRTWKYKQDVEVVGTVVGLFTRRAAHSRDPIAA